MTLYENLEEFCLNFVNYWNTNEELEDVGVYNLELRNMIDESVDDIERTIQQIREEEKKVIVMTENKRYTTDNGSNEDVCLVDNVTGKEFESDFDEIVDLLNEQEETIQTQKEYLTRMGQGNHLKIIMEQKERIKELEQENKRLKQGKYIYGVHGGSND